ncbi:MAG: transcription antitermination factor NusB [Candidatus Obscuribacterales bacterium]|nr:transcription antitermination factor NusB [Candidatus Obscuribacterales bacterium]
MSARRIARELAVIIMPQLPKDKKRLEKMDFDKLLCRSVQILTEHARQCLSEANGYLIKANEGIDELELEHPSNQRRIADISAVEIKSDDLKRQLELIELSIHLVSEALDIPEMVIASDSLPNKVKCDACGATHTLHIRRPHSHDVKKFIEELVGTYLDNHELIDQIIGSMKTKWRMERMVSIDRDILRLACAEAFFMPDVPLKVCINEAVELAHRFADARAAKFINGVLSDINASAEHFRLTGELKLELSDDEQLNRSQNPVRR